MLDEEEEKKHIMHSRHTPELSGTISQRIAGNPRSPSPCFFFFLSFCKSWEKQSKNIRHDNACVGMSRHEQIYEK
jgi:hypothetical protein